MDERHLRPLLGQGRRQLLWVYILTGMEENGVSFGI